MGVPPPQSVELQLAETGTDLVRAIEAAQFARVIDRGAPAGGAEEASIDGFAELFAAAAEGWEELAAADRAALLARLGAALERLEQLGWFVHWGRIELALPRPDDAPYQLPLAVLAIGRSGTPTRTVALPGALGLDAGPGTVH